MNGQRIQATLQHARATPEVCFDSIGNIYVCGGYSFSNEPDSFVPSIEVLDGESFAALHLLNLVDAFGMQPTQFESTVSF